MLLTTILKHILTISIYNLTLHFAANTVFLHHKLLSKNFRNCFFVFVVTLQIVYEPNYLKAVTWIFSEHVAVPLSSRLQEGNKI
jgi:hypothetical protein